MIVQAWFKYLIYIVIACLITMVRGYFGALLSNLYYRLEYSAILFYAIIYILLGISIGLLIGAEHFFQVRKLSGAWKLNLPKLITLGLPSLYISMYPIYTAISSSFLIQVIANPLIYLFRYGTSHVTIFQIILGYVIITSITKYTIIQEENDDPTSE